MKKIFTLALLSIMALAVNATDLFSGSKHVSWGDGGIQIEAAKFADAKPGDKIVISYTGADGGVEFKVMSDFHRLPGSLAWKGINGEGSFEQFLTVAAVNQIKESGLEIIGDNFTCTKIELLAGKDNVTEYTIWTGYFWMDEWSTIEIHKSCFDGINWADYKAIRFYSEAGRTDYVINVMATWSNKLGDQSTMTMTNEYAELSLEGVNMASILADTDRLMIQCNKEGGAPFNFTSVELVPVSSDIQSISANVANGKAFNLAGQQVNANAKGLVILNGKKVLNK